MQKRVVIDYLPESVNRYRPDWAVVAVDVIRATTTAITAAANGWRCFPVPTIEAALGLAQTFDHPLLAGESGGQLPPEFEMDNSPIQVLNRRDTHRPLVLMSSSGTKVVHEASGCKAVYLSCFRNHSVMPGYLANRHAQVAIIGAGSLGEFREEDQACCAWIAAGLMRRGYLAENQQTDAVVNRWRDQPPEACLCSRSVSFLKRTGRFGDLDFIFAHINDLQAVFTVFNGEVQMIPEALGYSPSYKSTNWGGQPAQIVAEH
jgi:2-phosphosulfolactate phosphatase